MSKVPKLSMKIHTYAVVNFKRESQRELGANSRSESHRFEDRVRRNSFSNATKQKMSVHSMNQDALLDTEGQRGYYHPTWIVPWWENSPLKRRSRWNRLNVATCRLNFKSASSHVPFIVRCFYVIRVGSREVPTASADNTNSEFTVSVGHTWTIARVTAFKRRKHVLN